MWFQSYLERTIQTQLQSYFFELIDFTGKHFKRYFFAILRKLRVVLDVVLAITATVTENLHEACEYCV